MELDVMEQDVMQLYVTELDVIKACAEQGNTTTANFVRNTTGKHYNCKLCAWPFWLA